MNPLRPGIRRLFRLDRWDDDDAMRETRDEAELHIALRAEQLVLTGMTREAAEREARRLFAVNETTMHELYDAAIDRSREMRGRERFESVWQDIRYAARRLAREPMLTVFILAILALGIGINVASLSVADRILLRGPSHVRSPDRLIRFYSRVDQPSLGLTTTPWLPYPVFTTLRDNLRTVDGVGAYRVDDVLVGAGATASTQRVSMVSHELFAVLGVRPFTGRFFGASDDESPVAVVDERFWRSVLGADPNILGKSIAVGDVPHTIVGIAPAGFSGVEFRRVDVWIPITETARNHMNLEIVARLKPGVAVDAATRDVARLRPSYEAALPKWAGWLRGAIPVVAPISYDATARPSFESVMASWLAAISAIILLATCANIANLLLARLARRDRELAVRVALGAGRARVMRLLALEGFLLAIGAAVLAFVVIVIAEPMVQNALFPNGSWTFSPFEARVVGAVAALALLIGMLVSVVPAVQASRRDVGSVLRGDRRSGASRSPVRSVLTVVQATLSVVLLVGAGLFVRSMQRASAVNLGMDPDRVLAIQAHYPRAVRAPGETFAQQLARTAIVERARYRALVAAARGVPGVETAAVSVGVPFYSSFTASLWVPGRDSIPALPGGGPYVTAVSDDYFATMGTTIQRGRAFTPADHEESEPVVIVSETTARMLWPNADALGKCLSIERRDAPCARVVGVAADLHRSGLKEEPSLQYYVPIGQEGGFSGSWLLVRPRDHVTAAWQPLRRALQAADPTLESIDVRPLSQGLDGQVRPLRLGEIAFGLSAALALVVAGLGLYSVMAHAVAWRRHEIGVRLALGATQRSIAASVIGRGSLLASIGIGLGLIFAVAARAWVAPVLFDTSATDPLVFLTVAMLLELLALLAGWLPVRRAASVSPTEALRAD